MCSILSVGVGSELTTLCSVTYDGRDGADTVPLDDTAEYPCLIRATDGGKTKFSTRVRPLFLPFSDMRALTSFVTGRAR